MNERKPMVETAVRHGELDDGASAALDELLAMARDAGVEIGPGDMLSRAMRMYYAIVTGGVLVSPSPELAAMVADARLADVSRGH